MSKQLILSICIPTFNRASFLRTNLELLSKIVNNNMEIVIGNDNSSDSTELVMSEFKKNNPKLNITNLNFNKRNFFDKNVIEIISASKGKFCWLLGDDDLPKIGSIKKIVSIINKYPRLSLIYLNYSRFDNMLQKVTAQKMVKDVSGDILFNDGYDFYFKETKGSYFKFLGTNTITMCTNVINRGKAIKVIKNLKKFIGLNFIHSFIIGSIIQSKNPVYFINEPQVQYLANNSKVWPNNIWKDYNEKMLGYLVSKGYPKNKVEAMRRSNKEFEQKEAILKNKYLRFLFNLISPIYYKVTAS